MDGTAQQWYTDKKNRQLDRAAVVKLAVDKMVHTRHAHLERAEFLAERMEPGELMTWASDDDGNFPEALVQEDGSELGK